MEIDAKLVHGILALDKEDELAARLSKTHQVATVLVMDNIVEKVQKGEQKITAKGVPVERVALLKELVERTYAKTDAKEVRMITADMASFKIDLSLKRTESEMMIWEVFFDHKDKETGKGNVSTHLFWTSIEMESLTSPVPIRKATERSTYQLSL